MRLAEEGPETAAGSARMGRADADLGWDGKEACHSDHWAAYPSCQAEVDRWELVDPYRHEDHDEA